MYICVKYHFYSMRLFSICWVSGCHKITHAIPYILVYSFISNHMTEGDVSVSKLVPRGYIFGNISKNWHNYTLKFLEYSLEKINYFEVNLENMLLSKYLLSSSFIMYHNQIDSCFMVNPNVIHLKDWLYSRHIENNTILDKECTYFGGSDRYLNKPTGKQFDRLD